MILRFQLTRDGAEFVARVRPYQAHVLHRALTLQLGEPDAALAIRLGAGRGTVRELAGRFGSEWTASRELRFTLGELHVLHGALTGAAVLFVERGLFSERAFHEATESYREHFDALAAGLVEAVSPPDTPDIAVAPDPASPQSPQSPQSPSAH